MRKLLLSTFLFGCAAFLFLVSPQPTMAANPHPPGTLVSSRQTVWQINEAGTARLGFDSMEKFLSNRLSFDRVVPANSADLALPESGFKPWGNGVLFDDNKVIYQVSGGKKHGFTSAEVFIGQGFNFGMVKPGNLGSLPAGPAINNASSKHLDGTLILSPNGTIWTYASGKATAFPSAAILQSYGASFADAVPANSNDIYTSLELFNYQAGSLVNDKGTVWVISKDARHVFPTAQCFLGFGFNFSSVLVGTTAGLKTGADMCSDAGTVQSGTTHHSYTSEYIIANPGSFQIRMQTFDLSSGKFRVITDTAYDQDCNATCPTASLKSYADANGAQFGMNGTYFCPQDYSECRSIANSFFWKIIDTKAGVMVNARSGLGENDPFLTFDSMGQPKYFKRWTDYQTSGFTATAGINSPSLIENGVITLDISKLDNSQKNNRSIRGAIAVKGNTLYLVHIYNATVPDSANVLRSLGVDHALVLDGGGTAALLYDGAYKIGPARAMPNAILVQMVK